MKYLISVIITIIALTFSTGCDNDTKLLPNTDFGEVTCEIPWSMLTIVGEKGNRLSRKVFEKDTTIGAQLGGQMWIYGEFIDGQYIPIRKHVLSDSDYKVIGHELWHIMKQVCPELIADPDAKDYKEIL